MGVAKKKYKAKPKPKPVIDYPPVPTKKWIPPEKRKKPPKPEPKYKKPEGISQKLAISTLKKVWNKFDIHDDAGILVGHFSQFHKRFSFKSNGYQGACNSAIACVYSNLYKMADWTPQILDEIIIRGDEIYVRSTQQGDKCLIEIPPEKVHTSFFLGNDKITLFVSPNEKISMELISTSEEKAKEMISSTLQPFLKKHDSGIFYIKEKYVAIWVKDGVYYFFDPEEHDDVGNLWTGIPGAGLSFLGRFKKLESLTNYLYKNFPVVKEPYTKFNVIPCGIARIVHVNTTPPETFEELAPQDQFYSEVIEDDIPPPPNVKHEALEKYVMADKEEKDPKEIQIMELSPYVTGEFPASRRPSFLAEGPIQKNDVCRYPIPVPTYLKGEHAKLTYYTELVPSRVGILRGNTCQTNPEFSKYEGRQSMGNAMSALVMLRLCKSKHWIPRIVNSILEHGDILFRNAMINIPRTHSLRLSNFSKRLEYEGKYFIPNIEEYALVGQLHSQDYDVLDLGPALDEMLTVHDCCIILGPLILAVWIEDGLYYMFDPNERDQNGKAIKKITTGGSNVINIDDGCGVACVTWFINLNDLVELYINNTEKNKRNDRFYLSKVAINDYEEISDDWNNFKGIGLGKWILRGTFNQASIRFSPESRNIQGSANAMIALAMQLLFNIQEWSSDTVDEVLMTGDGFYKSSVEYLQKKGLFTKPRLMLNELKGSVKIRDKEACYELDECIVNGLICAKEKNDPVNLKKGLEYFFADSDMGIITTRDISLAIWMKDGVFYYLDPYSRDKDGYAAGYGTSCTIRFLTLDDLVQIAEANLDCNTEDLFNVTKVTINLYDAGSAGSAVPPLNNYVKLTDNSAILRSWLSENNEKYEIRKGRQTVPMCLTAISFNKLKPSIQWTKNDLDEILDKGDDLYIQSMAKIQSEMDESAVEVDTEEDEEGTQPANNKAAKEIADSEETENEEQTQQEGEEEPEVEVKVTSENVKNDFNIGPNNFALEFSEIASGNIKELLKDALKTAFEEEQTDENFNQEVLLEAKHYTVVLWRDDKAYYVFDSRPRDSNGEVIGKEDWDPEPDEDNQPSGKVDAIKAGSKGDFAATYGEENEDEMDAYDDQPEERGIFETFKEEDRVKSKRSPFYWLQQEIAGRACVVWFTNLDDLAKYLYENIPPLDRAGSGFTLKRVAIVNSLKCKVKYNEEDERTDAYEGDYYFFKEFDRGQWILRATLDLTHELFPHSNRGKQTLTASLIALAVAHTYEITCFVSTTPDSILVYGDKLYTYMKKSRKLQLLGDPKINLKEDEIDWIVQHEEFSINDIPKKICLAQFMVEVGVKPELVVGDIKAQNFEDLFDVQRGLQKFFEEATYGILFAKGLYVAVWKGAKMYYMFDGLKRGPNGVQSKIGTGCVTRHLSLKNLSKLFLQNLPVLGLNQFFIHQVTLSRNLCPRERAPKELIPTPKAVSKSAGLASVVPGKLIIRGTISQEDPRFGKGPNVMSAPIAIVALTMSIIHKPENWSRPIVDEIVILGSELYEDSVNELGFDFNPWQDSLDIYKVRNDFKLGVINVSCEFRNTDQKGYIDGKHSGSKNLREGLEDFFLENTHGILVTEPVTLALWEQKQDEGEDSLIFVFDPNPRSSTGMPLFTGTACLMAFVNSKMAAEHIIGCILDPAQRDGEFVIVPAEIVVRCGKMVKRPLEKTPTRSSVNTLPRCSKQTVSEQKKKLRKLAESERKHKEAKKLEMIGRNGYHLKGAEAMLRGYKSQNSSSYSAESRNKQDIPNCIVSVVMHNLMSIEDWNHKHIDIALNTGDQLYIDSYIAYGPKDPKLGMENILRRFFVGNMQIHITIYKPVITETLVASKLCTTLEAFFQQESTCILSTNEQWISLFFKGGHYFMFDPHERDIEGNLPKPDQLGTAVVIRFDTINALALKIVHNLGTSNENGEETFSLWIISIDSKNS
ncbi:uncharacterized protein LOC115875982 isoform X2 [Sitophilus oryzae]|uniref:Uncharacterized protein LOC115875982 isoform X2 n=1 Tax=Sitophilus oryzae TaxID=7048 RepID=A0A6J2X8C7_SITOR|nr:uncharacterized protein LOC115875982 isoform X2 [Sitophilus oryzae]